MSKRKGKNKDNLEQTRALFLELGMDEFTRYGYTLASTSRIIEASGMARGSLYYHFKDKQDLFRAVFEKMMQDVAAEMTKIMDGHDDPWDALITATRHYFNLCLDTERSRIYLLESQAALPLEDRHMIINLTLRPVMSHLIGQMVEAGYFDKQNREMLVLLIFGALSESVRVLNAVPDRKKASDQFFKTFQWAMEKLR